MHVLFATSIVPAGRPTTGYEVANAAIVDALRRAGCRVTVMGFAWPGSVPDDPDAVVLGEVDVRTDNATGYRKASWLARAVSANLTFSSVKLRALPEASLRAALARVGRVDGYVLNAVQFAGAFEQAFSDRPSIFVAHNVEHVTAAENAAAASSLVERLLYLREARLLKSVEARLCARAAYVWTLAEEDRAALGVAAPGRSAALPLVSRLDAPPAPAPRAVECDAALVGTWTWAPNRIGLEWFLREVVPLLPDGFSVRIAGKCPADIAAAHPRVAFHGFVPDPVAFASQAKVVPLVSRAGTGVQLKTIETFERGLPSVATSRSLRGIAARPANCVVADDPASFAAALVAMAARPPADVDGRGFHAAQRAALDREVAAGLARLAATGLGQAA